jgi:hypothetical protein
VDVAPGNLRIVDLDNWSPRIAGHDCLRMVEVVTIMRTTLPIGDDGRDC